DNLLVKIYEQYKLNNPDSHGDFATRILNDLLPGGEDVITKLTAQNVVELMSYAQDSSTLLTFNVGNKVSGVDIQPNHAYTVLGFDANGNIKIQDPQTNKIITVDKTKYEALDAQIEGKTFALDGIVDGSKGRFVAGSEWESAGDTIRRIRAKNEKFISQLDEAHKITIGGREFFATEAQKAEYNKMLASFDGKVEPEVAQQLVMSDVMLPEALAKLGGIDISDCKTQEQVFKKLVEAYIENDGIFDKLGLDQNYIDAYLSRDSLTHSLSTKNGMSGDKIVHEICKALAGKLEDDESFAQEWSKYCSTSEVYKQYSTMVKVYETELKNTLGSNYQYLRNAEHLIFRILQRDSIVDTSSLANKELSMDLSGYDVDDLPTFIDNLAKLISEVNAGSRVIEFDSEGEAPPVEFMNGILMITKDPKTGKIMIETYEYKFSQGQKWDTHADYIPQAPSW
ncbi:MAG: hypothetical protein IJW73_02535, partial [Candidatus Gastranaerophilales bacterium]|nr:hypothetical protein [Candidatus Gastranaerophilales bacterium]